MNLTEIQMLCVHLFQILLPSPRLFLTCKAKNISLWFTGLLPLGHYCNCILFFFPQSSSTPEWASKFSIMSNISDWISQFLNFAETRVRNEEKEPKNIPKIGKSSHLWPRLLSFAPNSQDCEEEFNVTQTQSSPCNETCNNNNYNPREQPPVEECEEEEEDNSSMVECDEEGNEISPSRRPGCMSRKLGYMFRGARYGLREGALTGVFFGGGYGLYKYAMGKADGSGNDSGGQEDGESTTNYSDLFVSAANGAIAMAVFCMFFCTTKAAFYCC